MGSHKQLFGDKITGYASNDIHSSQRGFLSEISAIRTKNAEISDIGI